MYDPKFSVKQMYDQYGSSRTSTKKADPKPPKSSGFSGMGSDPAERFGGSPTRGLGSKPRTFGGGQDNNPNKDEYESKSAVAKLYDRAVTMLRNFGADEPEDVIVDGKRVYQGPLFRGYDPTTSIGDFGGESGKKQYLFGMPSLGEVTPRSPTPPTLPPADTNPTLNMFGVTRGFARDPDPLLPPDTMVQPKEPEGLMGVPRGLAKAYARPMTAAYEIQSGDTLSEIAAATGTTVKELADLNQISDVDVIEAGADLQIPIKRLEDEAVVTQATSMEDLKPIKASFRDVDPDAEFYSSFTQNVTPDSLMMGSYSFMDEGTEFTKALKAREADNYDTIFGNAEKRKSPFKGTKISNKTIKEVLDFVEFDGEFHKYNKGKGFNTTAVGKYQIVGQTLRDLDGRGVLKSLGITDDTKFDGPTQDKIAAHLAVNRIKNRATGGSGTLASRENARDEMRKEWEGFKKLSDKKLDKIIDEIAKDVGVTIYEGIDYKDPNPGKSIRPRIRPLGLPTGTDI